MDQPGRRPALETPARLPALAAAREIGAAVAAWTAEKTAPSGDAGIAVFFAYLERAFPADGWGDATPEEIDTLKRSQSETGWIPSGLEPGFHEPSSIGLRRRGRIAGWAINHAIAAETVRLTCSYIERPLAARGLSFALLRESVRRLGGMGVRWCTFMTYVEHPRMVRFVEQRCAPWASFFGEMRGSSKDLRAGG